jgi:GTPase
MIELCYCVLIVGTTCEHLGFCIALQLPILVVVTKVDLCTADQVESVLKQLEDVLTGSPCKKIPQRVTTEDHVYTTAQRFVQNCICPIFVVSNVTGYNLELITKFLNTVPKQLPHQQLEQELMEFQVDDIYVVPSVGVVVGGSLTK